MKESRKHACGNERPSKLVYIYHALLVQKGEAKGEEKRRNREGGSDGGSQPVLLFVIYVFHKHEWLNL
jgi:hypothetical protein